MTKDKLEAMVERASEAIYDFLDARFPEGAMPGGQQLFADDHLDAEFKHEAGCDELARAALNASGLIAENEELRGLRNLVCCAEADVTPKMMRELFSLPDFSSEGRAALQPSDTGATE